MSGFAVSGVHGGHVAHTLALLGSLARGARTGVPVDPDADTARRWARDELSKAIYHQRPSLLQMLWRWLQDQWQQMQGHLGQLDTRTASIAVVGLLLAGGLIALAVAGPVRRARVTRRPSVVVFGDDTRTARQLREAAEALAAQGLWSQAVLERFRALLRGLEERTVLDERPGRTAHEAAHEAGLRLAGHASDLDQAGRLFDDVCYGDAEADRSGFQWLAELDGTVARTRPAGASTGETVDAVMAAPR